MDQKPGAQLVAKRTLTDTEYEPEFMAKVPGPATKCAECGAKGSYRKQMVTGGGWRAVYRCAECGHRFRP
ncbi:hypothetical protein ACFQH3_09075 [Haladaptatus sp. GCM10025707]|uniref:hypothetical protein n=1 Tax=Haladaptatus sp. GCM10025707 TaxID=3252658 RepID=UPI0036164C0E